MKGAKTFGLTYYLPPLFSDFIDMFSLYYDSQGTLDETLEDLKNGLFSWDKDSWNFYQLIQGNKEYNPYWFKEFEGLYYLQAGILQSFGIF